jgi:hypothetical protein
MTMIPSGVFCANSVNYIFFDDRQAEAQFVLGVLNSRLLNWIFSKFSTNSNINGYEVDNLPMPAHPNPKKKSEIVELVKQILVGKKTNPDANTAELEHRIDRLVYELFDITPDEIRLVEECVP